MALGLLGSHVAGRAHHLAGQGVSRVGVQELGQAEVADLGDTVGGQEDVAGLEVAMDDPGLVGGVDGAGEGLDQRGGLARGHGLLGQPLGEAAAFGEFEREIGRLSWSPMAWMAMMFG